jgi:hypothetical protein
VKFSGYKFEVVDIDNYRIDQLLVTRLDNKPTVLVPNCQMQKKRQRRRNALQKHQRLPSGAVFLTTA